VYDAILAKLNQLQTNLVVAEGGGTELAEQITNFIQSLQKEKGIFMSKLTVAREQDIDPNELRDLTRYTSEGNRKLRGGKEEREFKNKCRILYANFVMWNSILNEVVNNANNADAYKSKLQNRKLNISISVV
jgi:hypothetical protein